MTEEWLYCKKCGSSWFTITETEYGVELACYKCAHYIGVHLKDAPPEPPPWWRYILQRLC